MKECKRHKWRVGSGIAEFIVGEIKATGFNIWCEKCDKKIKAKYEPHKALKMEWKEHSPKPQEEGE